MISYMISYSATFQMSRRAKKDNLSEITDLDARKAAVEAALAHTNGPTRWNESQEARLEARLLH
jgi:hypothetical protein